MLKYFKWHILFQRPRVFKYKLLSNNKRVSGRPICNQPALLIGKGEIRFGNNVHLGYYPSPFFYNGYIHLESRSEESVISIGNNTYINNNFFAVSDKQGIYIGNDVFIGVNCEIIDSDFHSVSPDKRSGGESVSKKVVIGNNVFLGNNVKIAKGVVLGDNVVVANGSVVGSSFDSNVIIGGVPAKIIGTV